VSQKFAGIVAQEGPIAKQRLAAFRLQPAPPTWPGTNLVMAVIQAAHLGRQDGARIAVGDLSFGMHKGECSARSARTA